jgi:hypothetical protein
MWLFIGQKKWRRGGVLSLSEEFKYRIDTPMQDLDA